MNNMKRLAAIVMVLSLVLCFAACVNPAPGSTPGPTGTKPGPSATNPAPSATAAPTNPQTPNYVVKVTDSDGNPIKDAFVQICDSGSVCFNPVQTDAEGFAKFFDIEIQDGLKTRVIQADGYVLTEEYTYFENGQTELTLVLAPEAAPAE